MNTLPPLTTYSSFSLVAVRELMLERRIHPEQSAEQLGVKLAEWHAIEEGRSPLTLSRLARLCSGLGILPSAIATATDAYVQLFRRAGWTVLESELEPAKDDLLRRAAEYRRVVPHGTTEQGLFGDASVLASPWFGPDGSAALPPVYRHCLAEARTR